MTCLQCGKQTCFQHRIPWHQDLTCGEYDALQADPDNFRFRFEAAGSASPRLTSEGTDEDGGTLLREAALDERAMLEQERLVQQADRARKLAAQRNLEEKWSRTTVERMTKPCPGCNSRIEKISGW